VLAPTLVYLEDNLGGKAENCTCAASRGDGRGRAALREELAVAVETVRRPWVCPGKVTPACWLFAIDREKQLR